MSENKKIWDAIKQPPATALKTIGAGRLKGKSDISPQWRYEAMTDVFGVCGVGWKYTIDKIWREAGSHDQQFAFAQVSVYFKTGEVWSEPIQGIGGSMLIVKESAGLHSSDEGYKMAVTDALGTAMKMIGMAADVYAGKWDGSKYINAKEEPAVAEFITAEQIKSLQEKLAQLDRPEEAFCGYLKIDSLDKLPAKRFNAAETVLKDSIKTLKSAKKKDPVTKADEDLKKLIANKNKELGVDREVGEEG